MLKFLKSLFGIESPSPVVTPAPAAKLEPLVNTVPYKVPEPAAVTPIPLEVTAAPVVVAEKAPVQAKAPTKPKAAAIKAPAKAKSKAPAKPKAPTAKKPKISIAK